MRLPFWVDYHYRLIRREKTRLVIFAGWVALAVMLGLVLIPEAGRHAELRDLAQTMESRVAAAEKVCIAASEGGPVAAPVVDETGAECKFSSGAGIEAVTDHCLARGVAVFDYRPFRADGNGAVVTEALELKLEGLYPDIKAVLHWLEDGPAEAEIRYLAVTAGEGRVTATVQAAQRVKSDPAHVEEQPDFVGRADIFLDLGRDEPVVAEEEEDDSLRQR